MTNSTLTAVRNSGTANNNTLNLVDPDNFATYYTIEFVETTGGDLILDGNGGLADPDTQVRINGNLYNFVYNGSGNVPSNKYGAVGAQTAQVTKITVQGLTAPDGKALVLVFFPQLEPNYDPAANGGLSYEDYLAANLASGNVSPTGFTNTTSPPICFLAGTPILTERGELAVEDLRAGDIVATWDGGTARVIWQGQSSLRWNRGSHPAKPIFIGKGALGDGIPSQDLVVSPQHHVLIGGPVIEARTGEPRVLVPAKALTGLPGVRQMHGKQQVTYVHVLCDRHVILNSAGGPTESIYPGEMAIASLSAGQRRDLRAALQAEDLREDDYGPYAARRLPVKKARELVAALIASNAPVAA